MEEKVMYYDRVISENLAKTLAKDGTLSWLLDYVKKHEDLDILIGKIKNKEWISVYRGLTKIVTIIPLKAPSIVSVQTADTYKNISPTLSGEKRSADIKQKDIEAIRAFLDKKEKSDRYYGNKKEGFYQNAISREFGIFSKVDSEFVILDKEVVVGYENKNEKNSKFTSLQEEYKKLQRIISDYDAHRYGQNLVKKFIGNELDFLAMNKNGDILLIELKHGSNTSGIYLSPLQIGLYFQIFNALPQADLQGVLTQMLEQKKKLGLINPDWKIEKLSGKIIPVLIVADPNSRSTAHEKYVEILQFCRRQKGEEFLQNIKTYSYMPVDGLKPW